MNFIEAMNFVANGGKAYLKDWDVKRNYVYMDKDTKKFREFFYDMDMLFTIFNGELLEYINGTWEVVE